MDQSNRTSPTESLGLRLYAMINSNWITQALYVATELHLPDLLASGPQTSDSLAQAAGAHAPSLHRLLRALVTLDVVREHADGTFELRPMGALLQSDAAASLRSWAIFWGEKHNLAVEINAVDLLPVSKAYFRYSGSLTTPPCSEGVRWYVMQEAITVSKAQIDAFRQAVGHSNNRPVQPVNARVVLQ